MKDGPRLHPAEAAAGIALLTANLATLLLIAASLRPPDTSSSLGFPFWLWHLGAYAVPAVVAGFFMKIGGTRVRVGLALLVLGLTASNLPALRALHAAPAVGATTLSVVALVALAVGQPWAVRLLTVVAVAATLWSFGEPHRGTAPATSPRLPDAAVADAPPLLVIGIDGADWSLANQLLERGELPNLKALRRHGAWGPLGTIRPTESPVIWTTIATGREPEVHRIRGFAVYRARGADGALTELHPPRGFGGGLVLDLARRRGWLSDHGVDTTMRAAPALWNLTSAEGAPMAVVDWWVTWPAEPLVGYMVSDRLYYRPKDSVLLSSPESLREEIDPLVLRPEQVTLDHARRFADLTDDEWRKARAGEADPKSFEAQFPHFWSTHESDRRVTLHLIDKARQHYGRTPDVMVLLRLLDMVGHTSMSESELVGDHLGASDETLRRRGRIVSQAYREIDRAIGELVEAFGAGHVVVLSDHGFVLERPRGGDPYYGHEGAPKGVFVVSGPSVKPGLVRRLTVYDVMPLLAWLKRLPISAELPGRLPTEVLQPEALAAQPPGSVPAYPKRVPQAGPVGDGADAEMLERLRALGYLQ